MVQPCEPQFNTFMQCYTDHMKKVYASLNVEPLDPRYLTFKVAGEGPTSNNNSAPTATLTRPGGAAVLDMSSGSPKSSS